jgi:Flp pilus assembly protein TadG
MSRFWKKLAGDRRGNILTLVALALVPVSFAVGFGVDYGRAMKLQAQMNAAADAAALVAVSSPMMQDLSSTATTAAQNAAKAMFNAQVARLGSKTYNPNTDLSVVISTTGTLNNGRRVVVQWRAQATTWFARLLGTGSLPISGSASSQAIKAPYMNFYMVLDTSPSMLLPTTTAGMTTMRNATKTYSFTPYGCAFGCHIKVPHTVSTDIRDPAGRPVWLDTSGNVFRLTSYSSSTAVGLNAAGRSVNVTAYPNSGYFADNYWIAKNFATYWGVPNVELRIDALRTAAQQFIPYAAAQAADKGVTYKLQLFAFDYTRSGASNAVRTVTGTMADLATMSASVVPDFYAQQDYLASNGCPTATFCNNDASTNFTSMLTTMNTTMATPGDGTTPGAPQEVMFLVTDGMYDEMSGSTRRFAQLTAAHIAQCNAIKARGIRIAVLYTEYHADSLIGVSWAPTQAGPAIPYIEPQLQACASTGSDGSPLEYKVATDQSISDALIALFALTVQSAHLVQ